MPSAPTDAELLLAADNDAAAFSRLYRRHVRRVHAWFDRRIAWAAADLTAETFARAWVGRHRYRDEHDGWALPWLLGIAHNVLRESARRDRIETRASTADGARTTTRFERYQTLAATEQNKALLSLRAQHPRATVDATEAGYQAAQARVYAQPTRADG